MSKSQSIVASIAEARDEVVIAIKKPSDRYLDEFVRLSCAPDLLSLKLYPNAKEITESMAAFAAIRKFVGAEKFADKTIKVFSVGDGTTARTAALFTFMTRWQSYSIDPLLRPKGRYSRIERLHIFPHKVEKFEVEPSETLNVVVAVHSHAKFPIMWDKLEGFPRVGLAIPCCVKQEIPGVKPKSETYDWGIHSPHRKVIIWDDRHHRKEKNWQRKLK